MKLRMTVAGCLLAIALMQSVDSARAADSVSDDSVPNASEESGSYCGIYCIYGALNCYGKQVEFTSLLKPKYIGTMDGSSIHELSLAARDNGLQALPMTGLTRANLLATQTPIILHVNRPEAPAYYTHWLLFLGMENGLAKVVDAPHKPELVPIADVLARWDGVGLYVGDRVPAPATLKLESLVTGENLALLAGLLLLIGLLQRVSLKRIADSASPRPSWQTAGVMMLAAGGLAVLWHVMSEDGYARNPVAIRTVIQQHRPSFLPKLSVPELEKSLGDPNVVVVDARYPQDYQTGHLPGAINVPVFTTQAERRKLLAGVPKGSRVIVYCQSESCQFDETLGAALYAEGIENVALFPGGYRQWEKKPESNSQTELRDKAQPKQEVSQP